ncbi:putative membrane protein YccC [Saccharopolyspora erythraea NRRL 2338]|uniref:Integral membrane protein n=2 Tax=Saccharopolyspora erythraea TaxID=1836 RepID=A4FHZ1_SACEN|nr:FUSC family protein [Saccharopolyspora erythraea]EQD85060.1 membrane protein [Saccharopolyspora erythraea D]PFG97349.1 putative membrane protein YccC [Saccharopolyspora erythraea NRRL 2338]CAM03666.1 integral membrane protein [Saccharopolyspora erythraea NRRL 2338]
MITDAFPATRRPRGLLPAWLVRMLRPAPYSRDWTRVCAATVGIGGPQIAGLATGRVEEAVLASVGALCVSFSDLTTSYRHRLRRVGLTAVLGAIGFTAGAGAAGPWWAAATVVAVSLVSVLSSRMGDLWAAAGAQMLTFCVVATGQHSQSLGLGAQVLWFLCGEVLLVAMVAATWPFRRTAPAREAVARVFDTTVRMFDAAGTDRAIGIRQDLTRALNTAHDILLGGASTSRSRVHDRLYVVLTRVTPVVEAAVALTHSGVRPPERVVAALRELARSVRSGDLPAPHKPPAADAATVRALDAGIADLITAWRRAKPVRVSGRSRSPGERLQVWRGSVTFGRTTWLLALRMSLCLAVAEGIGLFGGLDQGHWIALTVALVLKPNSGSVFARTVLRALGSVLGVLLALVLLALVPPGWGIVVFTTALAAVLPVALSRHYGAFTAVVTALVLLQMSQSELFADALPTVRLVDSLAGCAIVLGVAALLRPLHPRAELADRIAAVTETVSEYVSLSLAGVAQGRSALRRRTYRDLSDLRAALQQQLMEPAAGRAERWWPAVILLERVVDAATERALLGGHIGDDRLQHAQRLVSGMRSATRQLRDGGASPEVLRAHLERVYTEVCAA